MAPFMVTTMVEPAYRAGSGEPLVLLHGFTDTWRTWTRLLPALQSRHEVLAWTLPGHWGGEPWDQTMPYSARALLAVVEHQFDDLGIERAHLVGSSLGGWLALQLATRGRGAFGRRRLSRWWLGARV